MATPQAVAKKRFANRVALLEQRQLIQDIVGHWRHWPRAVRDTFFINLKPTNRQRFAMTVFLLNNGLNPDTIREYYDLAFLFDAEAKRNMNYIISKYPTSNWTSWNISEGRST